MMAAAAATVAIAMGGVRYAAFLDVIGNYPSLKIYVPILALAVLAAASLAAWHVFGREFFVRLAGTYLLFIIFFVLSGAICLYLVFGSEWLGDPQRAVMFVGAVAVAWFAGWITPGASAGLGVREAVIVLLLQNEIGIHDASYLAVAYRLATTGGNIAFALAGLAVGRAVDNRGQS
jgi:hypothetical protein